MLIGPHPISVSVRRFPPAVHDKALRPRQILQLAPAIVPSPLRTAAAVRQVLSCGFHHQYHTHMPEAMARDRKEKKTGSLTMMQMGILFDGGCQRGLYFTAPKCNKSLEALLQRIPLW